MKTRQEIMQRYRDGDYRERQNIFFMYRYFRNEFLEIENREKRQEQKTISYCSLKSHFFGRPQNHATLKPIQIKIEEQLYHERFSCEC